MKKIENISTPSLLAYQQILGMANQQMDHFATEVNAMVKKDEIDEEYYQSTIKKLDPKVTANNDLLSEIDREITRRVHRDFKNATTGIVMTQLYKEFRTTKEKFDLNKKDKKSKLNLKVEK